MFYKFENNDELVIHAPESGKSIPKIPFKNIKVVLKDLKTGDDIRNISKNDKKYKIRKDRSENVIFIFLMKLISFLFLRCKIAVFKPHQLYIKQLSIA